MTVNFPTSLDEPTDPAPTDPLTNPSHAGQHDDLNEIIEAIETKVGINSSADTNSLDYKVSNATGQLSFATPALTLGTANNAGAATHVIRSDATIAAFDTNPPVTQAYSDAAATGSAAVAARRDHVHGMPAGSASFAAPSLTLATTNAAGAAGTALRTDAQIALFDTTVPVTQGYGNSAAVGTAAFAARRDHQHGMPSGSNPDTALADIYIATTGNDSTGTGAIGAPYLTLAKAVSTLPDIFGAAHTIHVADGTYAEAVDLQRFQNTKTYLLTLVGNTTTPTNVKFTGSVSSTSDIYGAVTTVGAVRNGHVLFQGITFQGDGSTQTRGLCGDDRAWVGFDRCFIQTSAGNATIGLQLTGRTIGDLRGNCTLKNATYCIELNQSDLHNTVAGTLTLTGTGFAGGGFGIQAAYANSIYLIAASTMNITACQYGIALSHHTHFSTFNCVISITNTSDGTSAIRCTDQSDFSTHTTLTLTHFTNGLELNSLAYGEASGTRTFTNITNASTTGTGAVAYLP